MNNVYTLARQITVQAAQRGPVTVTAQISRVGRSVEARIEVAGLYCTTVAGLVSDVLNDVNSFVESVREVEDVRLEFVLETLF